MKNVLLLIHDDAGQESRLQAALDVARALEGHLICLDLIAIPPSAYETIEFSGGAMLLEEERRAEAANRRRVEEGLTNEGVSWSWAEVTDYVEPALRRACDLADVIVVNTEIDDLPLADLRTIAGRLAVQSGKPVLAVPAQARGIDVRGAALVAWDGSDPASAALTEAVPLLQLAESVTLLQIEDEAAGSPAEEAAAYLSRHDIHVEINRFSDKSELVASLLLAAANTGRYAYVVMGAYSKPRLLEALFGGVTRKMLQESPIPLLLAH